MDAEELRRLIEAQGYEVKSIRVFKKSFHVNFQGPDCRIVTYYKVPLNSLDWSDLKDGFPKLRDESG